MLEEHCAPEPVRTTEPDLGLLAGTRRGEGLTASKLLDTEQFRHDQRPAPMVRFDIGQCQRSGFSPKSLVPLAPCPLPSAPAPCAGPCPRWTRPPRALQPRWAPPPRRLAAHAGFSSRSRPAPLPSPTEAVGAVGDSDPRPARCEPERVERCGGPGKRRSPPERDTGITMCTVRSSRVPTSCIEIGDR